MGHEKHLEKMNQTVTFWLVRKLIVGLLCICSTAATFAQTATVSGVVKDDTGEPVIGAGAVSYTHLKLVSAWETGNYW